MTLALMSPGSTTRPWPVEPSHSEWKPSAGQISAVSFMTSVTRAALWADPGAGKTSITLAAFAALRASGLARTMLVVAPLRVCQLQWRQEAAQWTQFKDFRIVFLHGPKKDDLLRQEADIYLINFDGLVWLKKQFRGNLPFDVVCLDESTKIKNYSAERSKALRKCTERTPIKWMLTGTPSPNGYMDLFGQFLWLDGGGALGQYITHFREKYFRKAFNGFDYELQSGGAERIERRIDPLVFRLPYTDLPPLVNDVRWVEFGAEGKKLYRAMDREQVVTIGEHKIVAGSTGSHQSAREQMANGAIYIKAGDEKYVAFDDAKLDALDELIEEMNGQPLLVAFQFHHDIERIRARRGDVAVLAGGVTAKVAEQIQADWNAGKIKELYVHPASIGHGLNLQRGGASHVAWFSATFDLELWEQLIRRLWRQGNKASRVVNHIFAAKGTIDEDKLAAIQEKALDQAQLLQAFEEGPGNPDQKETTMNTTVRLGHQADAAPAAGGWGPPATAPQAAPAGGGWGPPATTAQPAPAPAPSGGGWGGQQPAMAPQAVEVQNRVQGGWAPPGDNPPAAQPVHAAPVAAQQNAWPVPAQNIQTGGERIDPAQEGMKHFSPEVQAAAASIGSPAAPQTVAVEQEKPKRTRAKPPAETLQIGGETKAASTDPEYANNAVRVTATSDYVNIQLSGLPPAAVRAALTAIAQHL